MARNCYAFANQFRTAKRNLAEVKTLIAAFDLVHSLNPPTPPLIPAPARRSKASKGWVPINSYTADNSTANGKALGFAMRDSNGDLLSASSTFKLGIWSVVQAEAEAMLLGLDYAFEKEFNQIIVK